MPDEHVSVLIVGGSLSDAGGIELGRSAWEGVLEEVLLRRWNSA